MKVSVVCRKFQRKEQRGGILLREQRLASVYISALWNSHRQYTQSTRFIFLRKSGRWSRKESLGPLTRNAVTLGSWLELQLKLNIPFAKTPQSQSASLLGEPATALNTPLPSPQGRASRVPWISLAQFIFAGLWLILYFTHWRDRWASELCTILMKRQRYLPWALGEITVFPSWECHPQSWPLLLRCPHACALCHSFSLWQPPKAHSSPLHSLHTTNSYFFTPGSTTALGLELLGLKFCCPRG